jgi:hypothetical protein
MVKHVSATRCRQVQAEVRLQLTAFFSTAVDVSYHLQTPATLTPWVDFGYLGRSTSLDVVEKNYCFCWEMKFGRLDRNQ